MTDNCLDDWRIAMTWQRVLQIGAEVSSNTMRILFPKEMNEILN